MVDIWTGIADLPDNWLALADRDLPSFALVWRSQRDRLSQLDGVKHFNKVLARKWAIETGIIEGLYHIDRGVTYLLLEKGLEASLIPHGSTDKPAEEVVQIIRDQQDTLVGLFDFVGQTRHLSTSYIKELHASLTRHQFTTQARDQFGKLVEVELLRGDWKKTPNNPTREDGTAFIYCPPEQVASEMDRLIQLHHHHAEIGVAPEIQAAWLHHRFTQIHPFQDGNGRVARALATLVLLRSGWFPLVIDRDMRLEYIEACEAADIGDLNGLVAIISDGQKNAFSEVFSASSEVITTKEKEKGMISAIAERLRSKARARVAEESTVFSTADTLVSQVVEYLAEVSGQLREEFREHGIQVNVEESRDDTSYYFRRQTVEVAKKFNYFANTIPYKKWIRLSIREQKQVDIVFSFHSLGFEFIGIMAVNAFIEFKDKGEDGALVTDGPIPICLSPFRFTYAVGFADITSSFQEWLSTSLVAGLDEWRRQL